jgi:hypothetical protein
LNQNKKYGLWKQIKKRCSAFIVESACEFRDRMILLGGNHAKKILGHSCLDGTDLRNSVGPERMRRQWLVLSV